MRGYTLVEMTLVLLLLGLTTASVAPGARRWRDRAAVLSAREAVIGLLAQARLAAVERGGASVRLSADGDRAELVAGGVVLRAADLGAELGVDLQLGASVAAELRYDALGIGRMASRTLQFRRGDQAATLVVSSYGRARRQ
ncbi:MAG TPA: hypothetical protein VFQ22_00990 [Longimicrobiales bacterium]|nr:hypothetical protein [Longimicrobiales bacterium]